MLRKFQNNNNNSNKIIFKTILKENFNISKISLSKLATPGPLTDHITDLLG